MASKSCKSTRVRAVPDFSKLHNKWQEKLQSGKACTKKPCTVVHEFDFSQGGAKQERVRTRSMNNKQAIDQTKADFRTDKRALQSIMNNEGLSERNLTGRATVAGGKQFPKTNHGVRQSEYSGHTKIRPNKEYTTAKTRLPTKSTKRKATSPLTTDVQKDDVQFETDQKALQSILENKGVSAEEMTSQYCPTNQKAGKDFKTPCGPVPKHKGFTEVRESMYSRVAIDRESTYTDYKSRILSRLTQCDAKSPAVASLSPATELRKDKYRIFEPIRNSMYVRAGFPAPMSNVHKDQVPSSLYKNQKPSRVLKTTTPGRSSAVRENRPSSLKVQKWKDVLGKSKDPVKKTLMFEGESEVLDNNAELEKIAEKERRLMKQISSLESSKQERKRQRKDSQSKSEATQQDASGKSRGQMVLPPTEQRKNRLELLEQGESELQAKIAIMEAQKQERLRRSLESENPLPSVQEQPRNPFQQLSKEEIVKRSINIGSESDSESEDVCSSGSCVNDGCQKYPQSPLAKDDACKVIKPNMVSHGAASKVHPTAVEGSAGKHNSRSLAGRSPRCRDLWSPNRGRVEKSPRRIGKVRSGHTPPRSPRPSWSKEGPGSPLFSHVMSKVGEQMKKTPLGSFTSGHVRSVEMGMDKENMTPAFLEDPSPKIYRYTTTQDDPMMKDVLNNSVDKLNQSIADITYQFEELENEALVLGEKSFQESDDVIDNNDILGQLEAIKRKQEELVKKERCLQKQLFRQKYGSPKIKDDESQPVSAKKRLQMVRVESGMDDDSVQKSENVSQGVPEITEKTSKLELCNEQKENIVTNSAAVGSDKMDTNKSDEIIYENVFPTPPLPPRSKAHRIVSPEPLRPKLPSPRMILQNQTFSPKPRMAGPAQLFRCISQHLDAPIQTPLVLRSAALESKLTCVPGVVDSAQQQNSPIDLSLKSGNSSLNSTNSSSSFSPDISFSYVDKKKSMESNILSTQKYPITEPEEVHFMEPAKPADMSVWRPTMISDVQRTPASSSTKFTNTMTTAVSRRALTMSSDSDILSSQLSTMAIPVPGSLSLLGNIPCSHATPSRGGLQSYLVAATTQKYYDALMDDEVALFMDRLSKGAPQVDSGSHGCYNPLASLLENGDDMHFVPICEETESTLMSVSGSAFASYICI